MPLRDRRRPARRPLTHARRLRSRAPCMFRGSAALPGEIEGPRDRPDSSLCSPVAGCGKSSASAARSTLVTRPRCVRSAHIPLRRPEASYSDRGRGQPQRSADASIVRNAHRKASVQAPQREFHTGNVPRRQAEPRTGRFRCCPARDPPVVRRSGGPHRRALLPPAPPRPEGTRTLQTRVRRPPNGRLMVRKP